ncbi:MAG TPA: hypothetical protein VFG23_12620, partial [Polyangia bacterium]|nr:hypothetical protein [Polyangia bacterium]
VSDEEIFLLVAALSQCHGRIVHDPRSAVDLDQVFRSPRDIVHRLLGRGRVNAPGTGHPATAARSAAKSPSDSHVDRTAQKQSDVSGR